MIPSMDSINIEFFDKILKSKYYYYLVFSVSLLFSLSLDYPVPLIPSILVLSLVLSFIASAIILSASSLALKEYWFYNVKNDIIFKKKESHSYSYFMSNSGCEWVVHAKLSLFSYKTGMRYNYRVPEVIKILENGGYAPSESEENLRFFKNLDWHEEVFFKKDK